MKDYFIFVVSSKALQPYDQCELNGKFKDVQCSLDEEILEGGTGSGIFDKDVYQKTHQSINDEHCVRIFSADT